MWLGGSLNHLYQASVYLHDIRSWIGIILIVAAIVQLELSSQVWTQGCSVEL